MKLLVTVRGNVDFPTLLVVETETGQVEKRIEYPNINISHVPRNKRGLAGIALGRDVIFITGWHFILVLDRKTLEQIDVIYDNRFSDLHDCMLFNDELVIANTNLDGVYSYSEGIIKSKWHAWEKTGGQTLDKEIDYSMKFKQETGLHRYHLNAVAESKNHIICTFLGTTQTKIRGWRRFFTDNYKRRGGYIILNKQNGSMKTIWNEGLHDLHPYNSEYISTEYFGNNLSFIDPSKKKVRKLLLKNSPYLNNNFLLRGVLPVKDGFIIGHTVRNGWTLDKPQAVIAYYDSDGQFISEIVKLDGVVGVYSITNWCNGD